MINSIVKAVKAFDLILSAGVDAGSQKQILSARNGLVEQLRDEAKSLHLHAKNVFEQATNCYASGNKQTKVNRLFKSAKQLDDQAEEIEAFLMSIKKYE